MNLSSSSITVQSKWRMLLLAFATFVLVFILWQTPSLSRILYPFRLLVTFVHETGHGLTAILTGGCFIDFVVDPNGSGLATTAGGNRLLITSMGYMGASLFGALLLYASYRVKNIRLTVTILGLYFIACALFFGGKGYQWIILGVVLAVGLWLVAGRFPSQHGWLRLGAGLVALLTLVSVFTMQNVALLVGLIAGAIFLLLALYAVPSVILFMLNVVAMLVGLNAITDIWWLLSNTGAKVGQWSNDAAALAQVTGLPAQVWILLWTAISLLLMGIAVWRVIRAKITY